MRSRARLERDTFTIVASSCARRSPGRDRGDLPDQWIEPIAIELILGIRQVRREPHWSSARDRAEGISIECETMLFTILTGAGVFNDDKTKAEAGTLSRRGLYPRIGRDSGENDRIDTTRFKLLLKIGSGKGAPVTFRKQDVAGLKSGRRGDLRNNAGQRCIPQVDRLVDRKLRKWLRSTRT